MGCFRSVCTYPIPPRTLIQVVVKPSSTAVLRPERNAWAIIINMAQATHGRCFAGASRSPLPFGRRVVWLSSEDQSKAFDFDVAYICLHAISKDPGTFPTPCIYCQVILRVTSGGVISGAKQKGTRRDRSFCSLRSPCVNLALNFPSFSISPPLPLSPPPPGTTTKTKTRIATAARGGGRRCPERGLLFS